MTKRLMTSLVLSLLFVVNANAAPLTVQLLTEPTQFDPLLLEDGASLKISANTLGTLFQ